MRHFLSFSPSLLAVKEIYTLAVRVVKSLVAAVPADEFIAGQTARILELLRLIENSLLDSRKDPRTAALHQKDEARREAYGSLVGYLVGTVKVKFKLETSAAARKLLGVVAKYGRNAYRLGATKQTATTQALLRELRSEALVEVIAVAGAEDVVAHLELTQNDFEAAYMQKVESETHCMQPTTLQARNDVVFRLNGCLHYIDCRALDDQSTYAALITDINNIIQDVAPYARARRTRLENEAEEEEKTPLPVA
jgi:ribosomal protein L25 (general stress protein Ctc)